jgi:hypothetical protein
MATKDRVQKWTLKYGSELLDWFEDVKEGKSTITRLSERMGVTKECARNYFHRYFTDGDLVGTRYDARTCTKVVSTSTLLNKMEVLHVELQEIKQLLKEKRSRN